MKPNVLILQTSVSGYRGTVNDLKAAGLIADRDFSITGNDGALLNLVKPGEHQLVITSLVVDGNYSGGYLVALRAKQINQSALVFSYSVEDTVMGSNIDLAIPKLDMSRNYIAEVTKAFNDGATLEELKKLLSGVNASA